jgi:hypothetical protein
MCNSQTLRILFRLCILSVLVMCLGFFSHNARSGNIDPQDASKFEKQITVTTNQLPPDEGIIPIELKCEEAELSTPNALEKLSCSIKNNTNKFMTAGAVGISIIIEAERKISQDSSLLSFDTNVHPDLHAMPGRNAIPPRGTYPVKALPTSFPDGIIKSVVMQIDYIEFADKTTLGPDQAGSRVINNMREGAAKYKEWLVKKYNRNGKSVDALVPLLEADQPLLEADQPLPEELELRTTEQQEGATLYRNHSRNTYKDKGAEGLKKMMSKKNLL